MNRLPGNPGAVDHVLPADDRRAPEHLVDPGHLGGGAGDEAGAGVGDGLGAPICDVHRILGSFDPSSPLCPENLYSLGRQVEEKVL